jgi:ribosomal protein S27AE
MQGPAGDGGGSGPQYGPSLAEVPPAPVHPRPRCTTCPQPLLLAHHPDGSERTQCEACRIKEKEMTTDQIETFPTKVKGELK